MGKRVIMLVGGVEATIGGAKFVGWGLWGPGRGKPLREQLCAGMGGGLLAGLVPMPTRASAPLGRRQIGGSKKAGRGGGVRGGDRGGRRGGSIGLRAIRRRRRGVCRRG